MVEIPGIAHSAVVEIIGGRARRELLQIFLPDHDGAGLLAPADHVRILLRDIVSQDLGTDGSADASSGDVIFDANGNTMQGAPVLAPHQGSFLLSGLPPS